jgi:hypothetical protein
MKRVPSGYSMRIIVQAAAHIELILEAVDATSNSSI